MSIKQVNITDIADFDSVDIVEVLVKVGDEVSVDQSLVTVESEKAMMDFPSPYAGVIEKINVQTGGKVKEGDTLVTIEVQSAEEVNEQGAKQVNIEQEKNSNLEISKAENQRHVESIDAKSDMNSQENHQKVNLKKNEVTAKPNSISSVSSSSYASPGVKKYARELGVNLHEIQGSGRQQRIVQTDVQQFVNQHLNSGSFVNPKLAKPLDFAAFGETEAKDMTKIQKVTAENMLHAWQTIPHVTHFDQADVTELEKHRKNLAKDLESKNIKLTPLAFVVKALAATLNKFPQFNVSLDVAKQQIIYKKYFHIGIAVDTPHGLLVPVLRDVDKKTVVQIATELMEMGSLARERKLQPKQMTGACMSISSLGNLGGQAFTPIINPPEVAILGLSKMIINETVAESAFVQQKLLPLSLSYDHRVVNGADAARFCSHLISVLEDIWKLIL